MQINEYDTSQYVQAFETYFTNKSNFFNEIVKFWKIQFEFVKACDQGNTNLVKLFWLMTRFFTLKHEQFQPINICLHLWSFINEKSHTIILCPCNTILFSNQFKERQLCLKSYNINSNLSAKIWKQIPRTIKWAYKLKNTIFQNLEKSHKK